MDCLLDSDVYVPELQRNSTLTAHFCKQRFFFYSLKENLMYQSVKEELSFVWQYLALHLLRFLQNHKNWQELKYLF